MATIDPYGWWWRAMASPLSLACLALAGLCLALLLLFSAAVRRMPRTPRRRCAQLLNDRDGTATLEFALALPIVLFLALLLTQTTLLMGGNIFMHYAAFAAARTAVVQIPADDSAQGEPRDQINLDANSTSTKLAAIQQAAAVALLPVAGRLDAPAGAQAPAQQFTAALARYYAAYNKPPPAWVNNLAADRLRYAWANTQVTLMGIQYDEHGNPTLTPLSGTQTFGPHEPITVAVQHNLNLAVPYVNLLFKNGTHDASTGYGPYCSMTIHCTLTNEGIINALPPAPRLPRAP